MSSPIISVENLGKRYRIHHEGRERYTALRDVIAQKFKRLFHPSSFIPHPSSDEDFWALKDVSFEVKQGEVVGIIGRNGAGKSTLLKILSRITEPTEGRITLRGRVASLLEVGTGFHPELSGRENIFLNGAILGMSRAEIRQKFDEIVDFAEVERFLDTPVKRYSSGMYVRLAFAVAAHLEPEILIVDEVLAVGDVDFQRKCIGAMERAAASDRTVLIVSHNLALVERLCGRCILLDSGALALQEKTPQVLDHYFRRFSSRPSDSRSLAPPGPRRQSPHFVSVELRDGSNAPASVFGMGESIKVVLDICAPQGISQPWIGIQIRTEHRELVSHIANREAGCDLPSLQGQQRITCSISAPNLQEGIYQFDLILADALNHIYHQIENACRLEIRSVDVFGTGMPMGRGYGACFLNSQWKTDESPQTAK